MKPLTLHKNINDIQSLTKYSEHKNWYQVGSCKVTVDLAMKDDSLVAAAEAAVSAEPYLENLQMQNSELLP